MEYLYIRTYALGYLSTGWFAESASLQEVFSENTGRSSDLQVIFTQNLDIFTEQSCL
ncbi:MAG: hypothetical protein ACRC62_04505 [Microcoleus sp.]